MREKIIPFSSEKRKTRIDNLVEDAIGIDAEQAKENGKIGYMVSQLINTTLPHKAPPSTEWQRRNGNQILLIEAGKYLGKDNQLNSYGLPYGPKPRLIMSYLCSEVVKSKNRQIFLGKNLSEFMRKLGLGVKGGEGGTIPVVKEQMKRLFSAKITFFENIEHTNGVMKIEKDFKVTRERTYWVPFDPSKEIIWESSIIIEEVLFEEIIKNPVPLHLDVLSALKGSSMDLDIYSWLTYRMSYLKQRTEIPWELLSHQFGSEYAELRNFKTKFLKHLNIVLGFYPANVKQGNIGLILYPSKTHIRK